VLAAGTWSVTQGALSYPDGVFPLLAESGEGCRLTDTSGVEYVDWIMGWGPVLLGYRRLEVERAIAAQLAAGPLLSLLTPLEIEVAELLREAVPCAEGVAFGKNGSDVLAAAVRIARAHTGRELVLHYGYHGFHDWYMAGVADCEGVPDALRCTIQAFGYNDLDGLRALFEAHAGQVAAVVMEPLNTELPEPGYLEGIRELTREHGALLVFDEVITGFRIARGGAQEAYGVLPDLACVGKGLANGMPLSALVGRAEFLRTIPRVGYGVTFRGETLSLAAARACLEIHAREDVAGHVARIGEALRQSFDEACGRYGVGAALVGPPARTSLAFEPSGRLLPLGLQTLFVQECLKGGVLTNGNFLPSLAHDEPALEKSSQAFDAALGVVAEAIDRDSFDGLLDIPALNIFTRDDQLEEGPC
jgi:glutamate-1-semialdehyde aminotransferase